MRNYVGKVAPTKEALKEKVRVTSLENLLILTFVNREAFTLSMGTTYQEPS